MRRRGRERRDETERWRGKSDEEGVRKGEKGEREGGMERYVLPRGGDGK